MVKNLTVMISLAIPMFFAIWGFTCIVYMVSLALKNKYPTEEERSIRFGFAFFCMSVCALFFSWYWDMLFNCKAVDDNAWASSVLAMIFAGLAFLLGRFLGNYAPKLYAVIGICYLCGALGVKFL